MRPLILQKAVAIRLRKAGYTYKEILVKVPVSKSSLSLWLQDMPLTADEKSVLKHRRDSSISVGRIRAAATLHKLKMDRNEVLFKTAKEEFERYHTNPLFYTGLSLYWAEGTKRGNTFTFTNSDDEMIVIMLDWMEKFLGVQRSDVSVRLYIHKPYANENCEQYWSRSTNIPLANFRKTIYKPTSLLIKKRPGYKGCLRIEIARVAQLRKYQFWQKMMLEEYRKQS